MLRGAHSKRATELTALLTPNWPINGFARGAHRCMFGNSRSELGPKRSLSHQKKPKKKRGNQCRVFRGAHLRAQRICPSGRLITSSSLGMCFSASASPLAELEAPEAPQGQKIHRRKQHLTLRPRRARRVTTSVRAMDAIRIPKVLHRTA